VRLVLLVLLLSGCAYQPRVTVSGGARVINRGEAGLVGCLAVTQRVTQRTAFEWEHCSDPSRGYPLDDRYDVSHDTLTIEYSWGGNKR
jgi:hypothetical protein